MTRDDWLEIGLDGWQPLLAELDGKLKERWPDYTIQQVKEKFGTLRFYAHPGVEAPDFPDGCEECEEARRQWHAANTKPFYDLIGEYEARTARVCEVCGKPGKLGTRAHWWSTRCRECSPEGWVANDSDCTHEFIVEGACDGCGRVGLARLEHDGRLLTNTHLYGDCLGEFCTIHNRSDHPMRGFPQSWRSDRMLMERVCPHGIGHPDPDDIRLSGPRGAAEAVHGCDGCCTGGAE